MSTSSSKTDADLASLQRVNDRLISTKNEDLPSVLSVLLPKLLPMANDSGLKDMVVSIVNESILPRMSMMATSSIKLFGVFSLIRLDMMPIACDLAIVFINSVIDSHERNPQDRECINGLISSLPDFELFSPQSDAICNYLLHFLKDVPSAMSEIEGSEKKLKAQCIFGDYLLDIMLLGKVTESSNDTTLASVFAGSQTQSQPATTATPSFLTLQPGLSAQRMTRVTARKASYTTTELKALKLAIIESLTTNFLPPSYSVAIAVVGSLEDKGANDFEVVAQALYKVNGAMGLFRIEDNEPVRVLESLLSLCGNSVTLPPTAITHSTNALGTAPVSTGLVVTNMNLNRSKLRSEVLVALLRFVVKDMPKYLPHCMKTALAIAYKNITSSSDGCHILITSATLPLVFVSLRLLEELSARIDSQSFNTATVIFLTAVKKVLTAYTFASSTATSGSGAGSNGSLGSGGRNTDEINHSGLDYNLTVRSSCYAIVTQIAVRNASLAVVDIDLLVLLFQLLEKEDERALSKIYTAMEAIRRAHQDATNATDKAAAPSGKTTTALKELIIKSRSSYDVRQRLASIQWVRSLFKYSEPIVLETMIILADDSKPNIREAAVVEFTRLRAALQTKDNTTAANDNGINVSATNKQQRRDIITCLLNTVVSNAYIFRVESNTIGVSKTLTAAFELVRTLSLAFASQLGGKIGFIDYSLVNPDLWVETFQGSSSGSDEAQQGAELSLLSAADTELYCQALNVIIKASVVGNALETELKHGAGEDGKTVVMATGGGAEVSSNTVETVHEKGIVNAVHMNAHLIRQSVSLLRSVLQLHGSVSSGASGTALRASFRNLNFVQYLMPYLTLPDQNLVGNIAQCMSMLCYYSEGGGGANGSEHDNYVATIVRLLSNKLAPVVTVSGSAVVAVADGAAAQSTVRPDTELITAANAIRCLSSIVELTVSVEVKLGADIITRTSKGTNQLQRMYTELINAVLASLNVYEKTKTVSFAADYLCITALNTLSALSCRGFLHQDSSTMPSESSLCSPGLVKVLHLFEQSRPHSVTVTVALMDAVSQVCRSTGVSTDYFFTVWSKLCLILAPPTPTPPTTTTSATARTASTALPASTISSEISLPVLKFAVSEALVRMATSAFDESVVLKWIGGRETERATLRESSFAAGSLPVLVRLLLSQVESAILRDTDTSNTPSLSLKSNYAVLLLVIVRHYASILAVSCGGNQQNEESVLLSEHDVKSILTVLLRFLKEKDAFIQDLSCLGICHLYSIACSLDNSNRQGSDVNAVACKERGSKAGGHFTLSEYVAYEVTVVLTRQKRATQPAGYSVAGEASSNNSTNSRRTGEANAANRPQQGGGGSGGAVAGGGGAAAAPVDPLVAAAAAAAAELGIGLDDPATAGGGGPGAAGAAAENAFDNDYGVYGTICKLCKKTGDSTLLFAVLALVRRDVTFGVEDTVVIYQHYQAPKTVISEEKLIALLPMLYHARFNPNAVIRDIMRQLWNNLIPEEAQQKALLGTYQREVLSYCVNNLVSGMWRDREASCLALEQLLSICSWSTIFGQVESLYTYGLNVLDDVRHSTRAIAISYMKALATQLVRSCNPVAEAATSAANANSTPSALLKGEMATVNVTENLEKILSLLVTKGMLSPSEEGRGYSLGLLVKIITVAHTQLSGQWLERLVSILIESMSALEPRTLQYMSFHTSRLAIKDEDLESMRVKHSQSTPMQEALTICLQSLSRDNIAGVIQHIVQHLRSGVGLATRVVAVESLCYLIERYPAELRGGVSTSDDDDSNSVVHDQKSVNDNSTSTTVHITTSATVATLTAEDKRRADSITTNVSNAFRVIVQALVQSGDSMAVTLKKAMTSALGSLGKIISKDVLASECNGLIAKYNALTVADSHQSATIAACLQQVVSRAGDRIEGNTVWDSILVVGYIGCYDGDAESKTVWHKIFGDSLIASGCGNKSTAVLRIATRLMNVIEQYIVDLSWNKRAQGVNVLRDFLNSTSGLSSESIAAKVGNTLRILLLSLKGRIWSHQGLVLETISDILARCHTSIDTTNVDVMADCDVFVLCVGTDAQVASYSLEMLTGKASTADISSGVATSDAATDSSSAESPVVIVESMAATTVPVTADMTWKVSTVGICRMLLHECGRGGAMNKEYSLHGARAICGLPWARITAANPAVYCALYLLLCKHAGIVDVSLLDVAATVGAAGKSASDADAAKAKATLSTKNTSRVLNNTALFGSRYGTSSNTVGSSTSTSTSRVRQIRRLNNDTSVSGPSGASPTTTIGAGERSPVVAIADNSSGQSVTTEVEVDGGSVDGGSPETVNTSPEEGAVVSRDDTETAAVVAMDVANTDDATNVTDSVTASDVNSSAVKAAAPSDPAYRMFFLDTLCKGMPQLIMNSISNYDDENAPIYTVVVQSLPNTLAWVKFVLKTEAWSVRRAAIQFVGALCSHFDFSIEISFAHTHSGGDGSSLAVRMQLLRHVLEIVTTGLEEVRYVKVRVEALRTLRLLVLGCKGNRRELANDSELNSLVCSIIRTGSSDSQPTVLEEVAKVQDAWING